MLSGILTPSLGQGLEIGEKAASWPSSAGVLADEDHRLLGAMSNAEHQLPLVANRIVSLAAGETSEWLGYDHQGRTGTRRRRMLLICRLSLRLQFPISVLPWKISLS